MNKKINLCVAIIVFSFTVFAWDSDVVLSTSNVDQFSSYSVFDDSIIWCNLTFTDTLYTIYLQGLNESLEHIWCEPVSILFTDYKPRNIDIAWNSTGIFLYWEGYWDSEAYSFVQKFDMSGNALWEDRGIELSCDGLLYPEISGGAYVIDTWAEPVSATYISPEGEISEEWQNSIELGSRDEIAYSFDHEGGISLLKTVYEGENAGCWFQVINTDGTYRYPNNGLFLCDGIYDAVEVISLENGESIFVWLDSDDIRANKLLSNDEMLYDDELFLAGGYGTFSSVEKCGDYIFTVIIENDDKVIMTHKFNMDLEMQPVNHYVTYNNAISHVQIKENDNLLFVESYYEDYYIREYDVYNESVTPEDGWLHFTNAAGFPFPLVTGSSSGRCYCFYGKIEGKVSGVNLQIIDFAGESLFEGSGIFLSEEKNHIPGNVSINQQSENTVICWQANHYDYNKLSFNVQAVDASGTPMFDLNQQNLIETECNGVFQVLYAQDNKVIVYMNGRHELFTEDNRVFCINTEATPYHEWDEEGIFLTDTMWTLSPVCLEWADDSYLIYYYSNEIDAIQAQVITNGEAQYPAEMQILPDHARILSLSDDYCTYQVSNYIQLTRLDEDLDEVWYEPVWLASSAYYEGISYEYISHDDNLVKFWVSYESASGLDHTWRLKKQIITPQGEKLMGEFAEEILDNGEIKIRDFFYVDSEDIIGIVCGEPEQLMIKYMSMSGEILSNNYVTFQELEGLEVLDIVSKNARIFVTYRNPEDSSLEAMKVYDLEGNHLSDIPENGEYLEQYMYGEFKVYENQVIYTWPEQCFDNNLFSGYFNCIAQQIPMHTIGNNQEDIPESKIGLKAYPNPFNPEINIAYQMDNIQDAELCIYNLKGQKIKSYKLDSRNSRVVWDGRSSDGKIMSSGIYLTILKNSNTSKAMKIILLK